jgi:hypothetical protein
VPNAGTLLNGSTRVLAACREASRHPGALRHGRRPQEGEISLWVDGDAWRGEPRDLEKVVAPVWVTVQNRGKQPVRLMYKDLALEYPSGIKVNPLPPFSMRTEGPTRTTAIHVPTFRYHGFYVAPAYRWYYPGLRAWYRPLPYDPMFYDTYYARWRVPLPTEDMLRGALPEGVLEPGGSVSGFLHFPDVPRDAHGVFTFRASVAEDGDGQTVASLDVPLVPR